MDRAWVTVLVLAAATVLVKSAAPVLLGGRDLPAPVMAVVALLASALLGALVVVETFANGKHLVLDARAAGIAVAAAILAWRREALLPAVILAAVVTALLRAV